jgi:hypothetical protein
MNELRQRVCDLAGDGEDLIFFDPAETFDDAILGVARRIGMDPVVVYDQGKVLGNLEHEMLGDSEDPETDALEHFEYNVAGGYLGERTPIFITLLEEKNG